MHTNIVHVIKSLIKKNSGVSQEEEGLEQDDVYEPLDEIQE